LAFDFSPYLPNPDLMPPRETHGVRIDVPTRLNLADELLRRAMDSGLAERPAVYYKDQVLTYRGLDESASRLAGGLRKMGIEPTDRVLLRFPNRPEFIVSWFALQKLGAVTLATMPLLRARELEYVANDSQVKAVLVSSDLLDELEKARPRLETVQDVVVSGQTGSGSASLEEIASSEPVSSVEVGRDDPALIAYTSGSTGVPKGCVHFPSDLLASADTYGKEILAPEPGDIFTGHPPLAFTFGLGGLLVYPLRFGAATCLIDRFTPETMLETITRYRATGAFCAPTSYKLMMQVEDVKKRFDLSSLRVPVSAGETLPAVTFEQWKEKFGMELLDGIGSTEMFHIFISSRPGRARAGSTGEAVPGYRAKVVDDEMRDVPDGQPGKLAVSGPTGCKYWKKPDRQKSYVRDGWNLPGDIYARDSEGYFHYQCRGDDLIITSGYNVAGPEVESVLVEHPAVAETAVVASPDELRGHIVKAFVVLEKGFDGGATLVDELQNHVRQQLAPYKYPREVEFVTELPRTQTGKIRRVELRQRETERKAGQN
jgi:2-aminobenzoate-CoA ligase